MHAACFLICGFYRIKILILLFFTNQNRLLTSGVGFDEELEKLSFKVIRIIAKKKQTSPLKCKVEQSNYTEKVFYFWSRTQMP